MTYNLDIVLPAQSANADANAGVRVPLDGTIVSAHYVSNADVAANGSNYATLTLKANDGAGGAFAAIATAITTASVAADADTARAITVTDGSVTAGQIVQVAKTYTGTGAAMAGTVSLVIAREHV